MPKSEDSQLAAYAEQLNRSAQCGDWERCAQLLAAREPILSQAGEEERKQALELDRCTLTLMDLELRHVRTRIAELTKGRQMLQSYSSGGRDHARVRLLAG